MYLLLLFFCLFVVVFWLGVVVVEFFFECSCVESCDWGFVGRLLLRLIVLLG